MEENIKQFLSYCERTGERPEKVNIDGKDYIVEWHPNKMLKRIYPKQLDKEEIELFYIAKVKYQGTASGDVRRMLRDHERDFKS